MSDKTNVPDSAATDSAALWNELDDLRDPRALDRVGHQLDLAGRELSRLLDLISDCEDAVDDGYIPVSLAVADALVCAEQIADALRAALKAAEEGGL